MTLTQTIDYRHPDGATQIPEHYHPTMASKKAFVCIATGAQGGATARQLRALGWEVHTTSRNPSSPAAQALTSIGVKVHEGTLSDIAVLETAIAGSDALFLALLPDLQNRGASELTQGEGILRVAKAAGVKQVVYSAGIPVHENLDPSHFVAVAFKAKGDLAAAVQAAGFPHWTVLQPGSFMCNWLKPRIDMMYPGAAASGEFRVAFHPSSQLPLVDTEDIGKFVAAALQQPERFHGHTITLASEYLTVAEHAETLRRGMGRDIRVTYLSDEEVLKEAPTNPLLVVHHVLRDLPAVDLEKEVAVWGVPMGTYKKFMEREKARFEETYQGVEKL